MHTVAGRDEYTGWYAAGGVETSDDTSSIGFAFSYTRLEGDGTLAGQTAMLRLPDLAHSALAEQACYFVAIGHDCADADLLSPHGRVVY